MSIKTIQAKVIHGYQRGRELGYPTANLDIKNQDLSDISEGVYAGYVEIMGGEYTSQRFLGACSFGPAKTFEVIKPSLEVYLLDFQGNLYGQTVRLDLVAFVREIQKFNSIAELVERIKLDVEKVRDLLV